MPAPDTHPRPAQRRADDLADLLEDLGLGLMLFAGAAIAATIVVLLIVL
jgi:hypothetical protein